MGKTVKKPKGDSEGKADKQGKADEKDMKKKKKGC